jgi:hypothetical protein
MPYIRLDDSSTSHHSSNSTSTFPSSQPRSFLMRIPQFNPRVPKGAKMSGERKRKLLLSYLPDW